MGTRKKKPEERENHERWLVSYADFMTLLFAFFTVLYATSQLDAKKLQTFVDSVQSALNQNVAVMPAPSTSKERGKKTGGVAAKALSASDMEGIKKALERRLGSAKLKKNIVISSGKRGITLTIKDTVLFDQGSAVIRQESLPILQEVGAALVEVPNQIRIEGHTDNTPIRNEKFRSNWELSTARATSIIQYFLEKYPLDPGQMSAAGYGEYRPLGPNDTADNRSANRRVDIVLLNANSESQEPLAPVRPSQETGAPAAQAVDTRGVK
ncbi:MAG TPA: flagellar motor protein MotB [Nitrospirota bacterium]|jgi:chemotaxis protein MotB